MYHVDDCRALYDSGIFYVDQYIGKLIKHLKKNNIYDNVMFIIVSDHGEHFNEHYVHKHSFYDYHGSDFYEEFIKVPLIIKYPFSLFRKRSNRVVSLIDVLPTVLNFYEIKIPSFVQGKSLLHEKKKADKINYFVSEAIANNKKERKMIRVGDWKYIVTMKKPSYPGRINWNNVTKRRLYNIHKDSTERVNLYGIPKYRKVWWNLEKLLKKILNDSMKNVKIGKKVLIKEKTLEQMRSLGYL